MILWFAGLSAVIVWSVFQSPAIDYRMVALGAVLPSIEALSGEMWVAHSLLFPVAVMTLVMLATVGRRLRRRRWLGLPIGLFLHLALDGAWADTGTFWWPFAGASLGTAPAPEIDRGLLTLGMEVVGAAALVWAWRRFGLSDPDRRRLFARTGQLSRDVARPSGNGPVARGRGAR